MWDGEAAGLRNHPDFCFLALWRGAGEGRAFLGHVSSMVPCRHQLMVVTKDPSFH